MQGKKISVYDLAYGYFKLFYPTETIDSTTKQQVLNNLQQLLDEGWTDLELAYYLKRAKAEGDSGVAQLLSFFQGKKRKYSNLLKPSEMYYHNELRMTTPPPVIDFDYDTGETVRVVQEYFLELRSTMTLQDLMNYFKSKSHLYIPEIMPDNRILGSFKWLVNNFEVELILFMIDEAEIHVACGKSAPLDNPSNIHEFFLAAKLHRQKKMNECKMAGGATIVPRKRK